MSASFSETNDPLVIITGPTGIGKSRLALDLAQEWNAEIVSADSMQVYRQMDIGTAKPSSAELAEVPHHMIDIVEPDEPFHAARYAEIARSTIESIARRGRHAFIVGGAGLYIKALLGGIFPGAGSDEALRASYRDVIRRYGPEHLHDILKHRDAKAAVRIDRKDTVRIIRALEVWDKTGRSIVDGQQAHQFGDRRYRCIKIALTAARPEINARIEDRVDRMIDLGLVAEVEGLLARGYCPSLKSMQSLGYKQIANYVQGGCDLDEALRQMKRDTKNYAKRQLTWFRADTEIQWFYRENREGVRNLLRNYLT